MTKILTFLSVFGLGALFGTTITGAGAAENATKPAYMIVSSQRLPGADYGPYSAAAGPLARDAGLQMVASSKEPVVLEGDWPYKNVTLEVYPSMEEIKAFWYSDAYQTAKKLREGLAEVNFIIAVEAD
jgi:uncharacterized protein (DUF1330 family)